VSEISDKEGMTGWLAENVDIDHRVAAVDWKSAVQAGAFLPVWGLEQRDGLERAMARVSAIGLTAVIVLFATGIYSAQLHVGEPESIATTRYGWALVTKVALVLVILGIAALNRWRFLPTLRRDGPSLQFRRALRIEALLLLAVIGATGWLTTSPLPH
jgi:copper transport protein